VHPVHFLIFSSILGASLVIRTFRILNAPLQGNIPSAYNEAVPCKRLSAVSHSRHPALASTNEGEIDMAGLSEADDDQGKARAINGTNDRATST
jgi:hypothetical protein